MIKVTVADFDTDNLKNFKAFIKKNFSELKVEKPAMTLDELENIIENQKTDLVIADMKLMGTGVIKLINDWSYRYPDLLFIFYGTFNDAEYMQKCVECGAVGYIYKPVKPAELQKSLINAVKVFEEKKAEREEHEILISRYKENIMFFETNFLKNLTNGYVLNEREIYNGFECFNLEVHRPYCAAVFRIDHFKKIVLTMDEHEKHLFIFKILNIINKILDKNNCGIAFINNFNEIVIVLYGMEELEQIVMLLSDIKVEVQIKVNLDMSIGVGSRYESVKDISVSFKEAAAALRYRCFIGYNSIIPIEYVEPGNNITYKYPLEREELLVYTAVIGEYDYCVKLLDEIFESLRKSGTVRPMLLSQIVMDILISINRNAFEQNLNIAGVNKFFSTANALKLETVDDAYNYLKSGLKNFCSYISEIRKTKEIRIFDEAKKYIESRYYENLTAKKVAAVFNCSYEYFKRLFKTYSGDMFSEYLAKVRIENAKKLIISSELDDEVLALKTGYEDVNVFRAAFKRLEGCTLSDYRSINKRKI